MDMDIDIDIDIDPKIIERLKRKIIMKENANLRTRERNDTKMVEWIKKQIEEAVQCYSSK